MRGRGLACYAPLPLFDIPLKGLCKGSSKQYPSAASLWVVH